MVKFLVNSAFWKSLNIAASFLTGIFLAQGLTVEGRGDYALFVSITSFYVIVVCAGIPESLIYFLQKQEFEKTQIIMVALITPILFFLVIVLFYFGLLFLGINIFYISSINELYYLMTCLILGGYNIMFRHMVLAENKIPTYNLLSSIETVINMVIFSVFYKLDIFTYEGVIKVYMSSIVISFIIHAYVFRKNFGPISIDRSFLTVVLFREIFRLSLPLFFMGISGIFVSRLNYFVLDTFHGPEYVGLFAVAMIFPNLSLIVPNQIALILYPTASGIIDISILKEYTLKVIKYTLMLAFLVSVLSLVVLPVLIPLLYGQLYQSVVYSAMVLTIALLFSGLSSVLINIMISVGEKKILKINSIILILGTIIGSSCIYLFDVMGTSYSLLLVNAVSMTYVLLRYLKTFDVRLTALILNRNDLIYLFSILRKLI